MRGSYDEENYLDDGDLPSLSPKESNSTVSNIQDATTTGTSELKVTKLVSYNNGLKNKTDSNGRQFWDQLDDESVDEGPNGIATNSNGNHVSNFENASTTQYDDDGPDDEMAARRAIVITPQDNGSLKRTDTDNSAPTDNESHLTDEDVEDEPYETTFCGQTLNAIEDMCGGGINATKSNAGDRASSNSRRSSTTSPPMDRKRRSPNYPLSADNSRSPRRDYPPIGELQQENTAIEVEYMEPIQKTTSGGSDSGAPSETKRKTVRLNAIAKKAKEKFRNKKGKASTPSINSEQSIDQRGTLSQQEIGSAADDDDDNNNISEVATKRNFNGGTSVGAESSMFSTARTLDATDQVDTDYNSFNAAEKRKFIKLINSGVVATIATRQVLDERTKVAEAVNESGDDIAVDYENEMDDLDADTVMDGLEEPVIPALPPIVEPMVDVSTSSAGTVPFQKSGSVYYDAVRRDVTDNDVSADTDIVEIVNSVGRPPSGFKGLEFGVAQRFFGGGKPKGFAALPPDSPQHRSANSKSDDNTAMYEFPTETIVGSGTEMANKLDDEKGKDVSSNTTFDSFVRNRVGADAGDASMESYQMTPTRDLGISDTEQQHSEQEQQQSPASGISSIANAQSQSTSPHSTSLNDTTDTLNETDAGLSTSQMEALQNVSHTEELDHSYVPPPTFRQVERESCLMNDEEYRVVSPPVVQEKADSLVADAGVQERSVEGEVYQNVSQIVQTYSGEQIDEQSQGLSFISSAKNGVISRMDMSVDTNANTTVDMSHQNDTMSVYTTGTSLTAYTQSSRTRRPGVAKTRLAKQKEIERSSNKKAQGWHETILVAAQSTQRKWDPEKGWVDYEEPEIVPTDVNNKKEKIRIDLNRSVVSHKERNANDASHGQMEAVVPIPFPREWEREREAMIRRPIDNTLSNKATISLLQRSPPQELDDETYLDDEQNVESNTEIINAKKATISLPQRSPPQELDDETYLDDEQTVESYTGKMNKETTSVDNEYIHVESLNINAEAKSIESDVYYEDVIVVEGDDEASRNVIEVVKQKVSEDDLELFPKSQRNGKDIMMNTVPANRDSDEGPRSSETGGVNTSLLSSAASVVSSRRGAGPVDTDEVDETWDSDDENRDVSTMQNDNGNRHNLDDLAENHHIDGWKDSSHPVPRHDTRSQSTNGNDTSRSAGNLTNVSGTSSSKKIPKLERSKRDTSPLSFRNPIEVAFPRSQESIQRHENFEVEYAQPSQATTNTTADIVTVVSASKASAPSPLMSKVGTSLRDDNNDTNIVQARLKEWESRIEISHSSDNGEPIDKNRSPGVLPVAAAGWRSFLSKKVQGEKTFAESQNTKAANAEQLSEDLQPNTGIGSFKPTARQSSTDAVFRYADKTEESALNLSDLSPIQVNDDLSDYDIASSVAYGPTDEQRKSSSFLERLTECAAPIMPTKSSTFCGRPEEVAEDENVADISYTSGASSEKHRRSMSYGDEKPKSLASLRGTSDAMRVSTSSVVSEDFGAKTAFLDSLAMKAAVSKPKRSGSSSRRYDQSATSSVVSGATDHSEKWKTFLERKKASDTNPIVTRGSGADVSRAAEKYAAEKVEEIMSKMAARSKTTPRHRESRNEFSDVAHNETEVEASNINTATSSELQPPGHGSISAAEDLAAARVEAMMAALANTNLDEGEI